jgi:hypothetical protein
MGKNDFLSPKAIGNRIKVRGRRALKAGWSKKTSRARSYTRRRRRQREGVLSMVSVGHWLAVQG